VPRGTRDQERHNHDRGACKDERGETPTANGRGFIGEASADAREKRGGNLGVGGGAQAFIHRRKERLFLGEGGAARGAGSEVRAQSDLWLEAGGGGFD
jgi:hypothetical protein